MKYIVAYDIASSKRLVKIAKILLDYGVRLQNSVFYIDADERIFRKLQQRLEGVIDMQEDTILCYAVCEECFSQRLLLGAKEPEERKTFQVM